MGILKVDVRNLPKEACENYIVARASEGELWYWGSWRERDEAYRVAKEIGGVVVENCVV